MDPILPGQLFVQITAGTKVQLTNDYMGRHETQGRRLKENARMQLMPGGQTIVTDRGWARDFGSL